MAEIVSRFTFFPADERCASAVSTWRRHVGKAAGRDEVVAL
jgi:hypothetical protein